MQVSGKVSAGSSDAKFLLGRQARRPRGVADGRTARELARAPGLDVEHPELLRAGSVGREHEMPAVRRPRRLLIASVARQLVNAAIPQTDRHDLKGTRH